MPPSPPTFFFSLPSHLSKHSLISHHVQLFYTIPYLFICFNTPSLCPLLLSHIPSISAPPIPSISAPPIPSHLSRLSEADGHPNRCFLRQTAILTDASHRSSRWEKLKLAPKQTQSCRSQETYGGISSASLLIQVSRPHQHDTQADNQCIASLRGGRLCLIGPVSVDQPLRKKQHFPCRYPSSGSPLVNCAYHAGRPAVLPSLAHLYSLLKCPKKIYIYISEIFPN